MPRHRDFLTETFINLPEIRKGDISSVRHSVWAVMLSLSFNSLTFRSLLLEVQHLSRVYSASHFHLIRIMYLQPKIVLWSNKPLLNDTLPSGSAATWTERRPLDSSVSGYLFLEGQGNKDPQPWILHTFHGLQYVLMGNILIHHRSLNTQQEIVKSSSFGC
jgi:hypothetical protein